MGILDFFKFTPPADKKYKLFLSNYLKQENHILECFSEIGASSSLDNIKVDYVDFAKHFRAMQMTLLSASVSIAIFKGYISKDVDDVLKFEDITMSVVEKFDKDIKKLMDKIYDESYSHNGIEGMVEALNEKSFKGKLNENIKVNLIKGFEIIELQFNEVIKSFF